MTKNMTYCDKHVSSQNYFFVVSTASWLAASMRDFLPFWLPLLISTTTFYSTYSAISMVHAHVLCGIENAEACLKYDPIAWFDTGVLMIYIYVVKAESCHAYIIQWVGITFVKDRIFWKSNDYASYIHGYYYVDIVTSSFLSDYTIKRLHDTNVM